jgi:solute carrier family 25 S-adenosylmethionine transporter 26
MKAAWFTGSRAKIALYTATASTSVYIYHQRHRRPTDGSTTTKREGVESPHHALPQQQELHDLSNLQLSPTLIEGISGAIGEVIQMILLYPLDTVKVRCQALGSNSASVVMQMFKASKGSLTLFVKSLYAGCVGGVLCSIPIGAVHFASFETSKRILINTMCTEDKPACDKEASDLKNRRLMANLLAACFAAIATAVIESPVELFRHNQQASSGASFMTEMNSVFKASGFSGLYWGFLPHCFESLPHDTAELIVYGSLIDMQADSMRKESPSTQWIRDMSKGPGFDLFVGGAAGAASVLVSMPFDR